MGPDFYYEDRLTGNLPGVPVCQFASIICIMMCISVKLIEIHELINHKKLIVCK